MMSRIYAIFVARNVEFFRDRAALSWSIIMPVLIIIGFAFAFSNESPEKFKVGLKDSQQLQSDQFSFLGTKYIQFISVNSIAESMPKVERHQLDMLLDADNAQYWINQTSPNGYLVERLLLASSAESGNLFTKNLVSGDEIRYIDWVIPGVLGMNIMFGALFGIGFVIVRYRKNGVLKRLRATPVSALEFLIAQIMSRLWLMLLVNGLIFIALDWIIDFRMFGSYFDLLVVFALGSLSLICLGLIVAARVSSEEVANGLLNLFSMPMMFLSGVWFSLEGAHPIMLKIAYILPLTHVTTAARAIMIDGAGLGQVSEQLIYLSLFSLLTLLIGSRVFRWE